MSPTVESLLKIPSKFTTSKVRILLVCFDAKAYRCEVKLDRRQIDLYLLHTSGFEEF